MSLHIFLFIFSKWILCKSTSFRVSIISITYQICHEGYAFNLPLLNIIADCWFYWQLWVFIAEKINFKRSSFWVANLDSTLITIFCFISPHICHLISANIFFLIYSLFYIWSPAAGCKYMLERKQNLFIVSLRALIKATQQIVGASTQNVYQKE